MVGVDVTRIFLFTRQLTFIFDTSRSPIKRLREGAEISGFAGEFFLFNS